MLTCFIKTFHLIISCPLTMVNPILRSHPLTTSFWLSFFPTNSLSTLPSCIHVCVCIWIVCIYVQSRIHIWEKANNLSFWVWFLLLNVFVSNCVHFPASAEFLPFFFMPEQNSTVNVMGHILKVRSSSTDTRLVQQCTVFQQTLANGVFSL